MDAPETIIEHRNIIRNNAFLREVYKDFYTRLTPIDIPEGPIVEIGSGGGFIKDIIPGTQTSDVVEGPDIDMVFSAEQLPYQNESVSAFVLLNTFHHIKDPVRALQEMRRCLKPGGKIMMVEPYNSPWSKWLYTNFHYEGFDARAGWKIPGEGRLTDANNALPWIVFVRDRTLFEEQFPELSIRRIAPHTPLSYVVSGGLTRKPFLPLSLYPVLRYFEKLLQPCARFVGMFSTIELVKEKTI